MKSRLLIPVCALALAGLFVTGCGGSDSTPSGKSSAKVEKSKSSSKADKSKSPEEVAKKFLTASLQADGKTVCALVSEKAKKSIPGGKGCEESFKDAEKMYESVGVSKADRAELLKDMKLGNAKITGDRAVVSLVVSGAEGVDEMASKLGVAPTIVLKKIKGEWKVDPQSS